MTEIRIKLWFHREDGTWSVLMGDLVKLHVSEAVVDEVADYAFVAAKQELLERQERTTAPDNWHDEAKRPVLSLMTT